MKQFRNTNYEIGEDGLVINTKTQHIKSTFISNGFIYTTLSINNKRLQIGIHRLVAEVYLQDFTSDCIIEFKDGDKTNVHYLNLQVKPDKKKSNFDSTSISQYNLDGEFIRDFKSVYEVSKYLGKSSSTAFRYALKHSGNYQGYHWKINNQLEK